jgi:hypothetical protein
MKIRRRTRLTRHAAEVLRLELIETVANRPDDLPRALAAAPQADAWFVGDHLPSSPTDASSSTRSRSSAGQPSTRRSRMCTPAG